MFQNQLSIAEIEGKVIILKIASGICASIILFFSKFTQNMKFICKKDILRNSVGKITSYSRFIGFFNFIYGLEYYMQTVASGYLT